MKRNIDVICLFENGMWRLYYDDDYGNPLNHRTFSSKGDVETYAKKNGYKITRWSKCLLKGDN